MIDTRRRIDMNAAECRRFTSIAGGKRGRRHDGAPLGCASCALNPQS
jgi:hypothetical protein